MASIILEVKAMGSDIVGAVRAIAQEDAVVRKDMVDGKIVYEIGRRSMSGPENVAVEAVEGVPIEEERSYEQLRVKNRYWGGAIYAVRNGPDAEIKAVQDFAKVLGETLAAQKAS